MERSGDSVGGEPGAVSVVMEMKMVCDELEDRSVPMAFREVFSR